MSPPFGSTNPAQQASSAGRSGTPDPFGEAPAFGAATAGAFADHADHDSQPQMMELQDPLGAVLLFSGSTVYSLGSTGASGTAGQAGAGTPDLL